MPNGLGVRQEVKDGSGGVAWGSGVALPLTTLCVITYNLASSTRKPCIWLDILEPVQATELS